MSFEPNKENFLAQLKDGNFKISVLLDEADSLREILWYLDDGRTKEIIDSIFDSNLTTRQEAEQIIKNLAKLYPLSKTLLMNIMAETRDTNYPDGRKIFRDAVFLEGFDAAEEVKKTIVTTFKEIESRVIRLSKETKDYLRALENLRAERDKLSKEAGSLEELRRERDNLKAEVDKLREDTAEDKLREKIDVLQVTLQQLAGEKRRQQKEIQEKERRIEIIKAELNDLGKKLDSTEEVAMIKDLLKKFPADAEDFEA